MPLQVACCRREKIGFKVLQLPLYIPRRVQYSTGGWHLSEIFSLRQLESLLAVGRRVCGLASWKISTVFSPLSATSVG